MPWSKSNTIPSLKNKSDKIKEVFAEAGNAALARGRTEEEAVFAGLGAVTAYEKKHSIHKAIYQMRPAVEPAVTFQTPADFISPAFLPKNRLNPNPERSLIAADFNNEGKLVLTFSTGEKIVTSPVYSGDSYQQVGVSVNPVFDYLLFNTEAGITPDIPGMLAWNKFEDCLDVRQADGTTLQIGLENYIPVINNTGATLPNASVVHFSGVDLDEIPEVSPFIANGSIEPLYLVGVLTNAIEPGQVGRATVFGKVRNTNTTGSSVGETWNQGDILWAHPTIAGAFTKVRPTAPNINISVAAVLRLSATDGILLVRPTIFPRLFYGDFSDSTNQSIVAINTPYAVTFNTTNIASGIAINTLHTSRIICSNAGLYSFDFKLQLVSNSSSKKEVYIWARKNGLDIPRSASAITMAGNAVDHVASWNFVVSMQAGDYFELMHAANDTGVVLNAPANTAFCPSTPSATMKVTQVNL